MTSGKQYNKSTTRNKQTWFLTNLIWLNCKTFLLHITETLHSISILILQNFFNIWTELIQTELDKKTIKKRKVSYSTHVPIVFLPTGDKTISEQRKWV